MYTHGSGKGGGGGGGGTHWTRVTELEKKNFFLMSILLSLMHNLILKKFGKF